jgi:BMFP domain-containing protein YqiC
MMAPMRRAPDGGADYTQGPRLRASAVASVPACRVPGIHERLSLAHMLGDMRKYVRLGLEALSSRGSEHDAGAMRSRAQGVAEQISALAAGFREWSAEARASLLHELRDVVARQVEDMGVATKKDLDDLRARLDRLEAKGTRTSKAKAKAKAKASSSSRSNRSKAGGSSSSTKRTVSARRRASRSRG